MQFKSVAIESIDYDLPERIVTSDEIEASLSSVYQRLKLPTGRLELMTGIKSRHLWPSEFAPSQASALAGEKVLKKSIFEKESIDLLIHSSVCRDKLEPATASYVHQNLRLSENTQILDVSNACLGFLNAMTLAAGLIESGQIQKALIVSGENGMPLVENTINSLHNPALTRKTIKPYFANLTIGAGSVAAILCHKKLIPESPLLINSVAVKTDSNHNKLCEGGVSGNSLIMQTNSEALLEAGVNVAFKTWELFKKTSGWSSSSINKIFTHQVGRAHTKSLFDKLDLDIKKEYSTYEFLGNIGSVSCPITLAKGIEKKIFKNGEKALLMGIGSGLSSMIIGLEWVE